MSKPVLTEAEVKDLEVGSPCYVVKGTLITALARELAAAWPHTAFLVRNPGEAKQDSL